VHNTLVTITGIIGVHHLLFKLFFIFVELLVTHNFKPSPRQNIL